MAYLKHWRLVLVALLFVWCIILIHPFSKEGIIIQQVEEPASVILRVGDIVTKMNDNTITGIDSLNNYVSIIKPNETLKVGVQRETYPYSYKQLNHIYIVREKEDGTPNIAFSATASPFSKIKFSNEIVGGNQFVISVSNPDAAINILNYHTESSSGINACGDSSGGANQKLASYGSLKQEVTNGIFVHKL